MPLANVGDKAVWKDSDSSAVMFRAGMTIDADGAPTAYHPDDIGLDRLANGGRPGDWWGIATQNGDADGLPAVQRQQDPAPGFYVSTTALQDYDRDWLDPHRYVDSTSVPYIVLPAHLREVRLGDFAVVIRPSSGDLAFAILADIGPPEHLGEGSIALAKTLGLESNPRHGGTTESLIYIVFPGSGDERPHDANEIKQRARTLFENWGGIIHAHACMDASDARFAGAP